jgi:preprotein translocase subunit SecE
VPPLGPRFNWYWQRKTVAEASKGGIGAWLRNIPTFVNQVKAEWGKIAWPTRRETVMTAIMVVVMTLMLGIFFFAVDWVFSRVVRELLTLAS